MIRLLNHPCSAFSVSSFPALQNQSNYNVNPIKITPILTNKYYSKQNVSSYHAGSMVTSRRCSVTASAPGFGADADTDDQYSKVGLRRDLMPKHVAILLDGNRRWLKAHGKPLDYKPFFEAKLLLADLCIKWGIPTATSSVYGLKTFGRGKEANDLVFRQFEEWLNLNLEAFMRKGIRMCIFGETYLLNESLQDTIKKVEEATRNNSKVELMLGVCYDGRNDLAQATKSICEKLRAGEIEPEDIDEAMVQRHLSTNTMKNPNPDLLIRTGGYVLLSNFMIWELADAELYFTDIYAPEFNEAEFIQALRFYQKTERVFDK